MPGLRNRCVQQGFVSHEAARFDAARGSEDQCGLGIIDPRGQLIRRKSSKHHRVNGADAGASEHCDHRFRDHRHIDDDAITPPDTKPPQRAAQARRAVPQLHERDVLCAARHGTVIDEGGLVRTPAVNVPVDGVVAGVQHPAGKPPVKWRPRVVENLVPRLHPSQRGRGFRPELFAMLPRARANPAELICGGITHAQLRAAGPLCGCYVRG